MSLFEYSKNRAESKSRQEKFKSLFSKNPPWVISYMIADIFVSIADTPVQVEYDEKYAKK